MAKSVISVKLNSSALEKQIKDAMRRNPEVTTRKVSAIAMDLAGKSARMAPVETGDLRNNCVAKVQSAVVFENQTATKAAARESTEPRATVGYSLPYALRQHEDIENRHDRTDGKPVARATRYKTQDGEISTFLASSTVNMVSGGEAKFLEKPFKENEKMYIEALKSIPEELLK